MVFKSQRGDTLVEVLMAIVVMSLVVVGAITMMTRGLQAGQIALEHSEVRLEINSQIELLRYLRNQYSVNSAGYDAGVWRSIITTSNNNPSTFTETCTVTPAKAGTDFYLDKSSGQLVKKAYDSGNIPSTYAKAGQGVWVEATPSSGINPAFVDFVIHACWDGPGGMGRQSAITAVRLYDPS